MSFTHRPMQAKDMEACFDLLQERFLYDDARRKQLFSLWRHLLETQSCQTVVVEDRRLPRGRRHVSFGLSLFIPEWFLKKAKDSLRPFLPLRILEFYEKNKRPFLNHKEIEATNSKGELNLLILHYGWEEKRISPEDTVKARHFLKELFIPYHAGYRFKEFLEEVYGSETLQFMLNSGVLLRRDYKEFAGTPLMKGINSQQHPYLMGFTLPEGAQQDGTHTSTVVAKSFVPRFHFSPGQKEILVQALNGQTDEGIAESLGISPWTIKKRWQAIYGKVLQKDADLLTEDLPKGSKAVSSDSTGRLKQRRRFLLEYLRHHPEEIR